jgi:hypothetical protein
VKRFLSELLVQALAFSPLLLAGYWLVADHGQAPERVVIDAARLAAIRTEFRETWSRYPTGDEMRGLVASAVGDEILVREAEALGIGPGDPALEQRVRQKYESLADERLAGRAPSQDELVAWFELHAARYARPPTLSYSQLLLVAAGTTGDAVGAARRLRVKLNRGVKPSRLGLKTELPSREHGVRLDEIARDYGPHFANIIAQLPVGTWSGPVESNYGAHLVRVESIVPGRPPPFEDVRGEVMQDFERARRQRELEADLAKLRRKYEVIVEPQNTRQATNSRGR